MIEDIAYYLFYFILFAVFIYNNKKFRTDAVAPWMTVLLFTITCLFTQFNLYAHANLFHQAGDMKSFQKDALILNHYLALDFSKYYGLMTQLGGKIIPDQLSEPIYLMSHWANMSNYFIIKLYAIFIALSNQHFYVFSIFFSLLSFLGKWLICYSFKDKVKNKNHFYILIAVCFLLPNESFWTAGLHKETLLIFSIGLIFYGLSIEGIKGIVTIAIGMFIMFLARDFYLFCCAIGLMIHYFINYTSFKLRNILIISALFTIVLLMLPIKLEKSIFEVALQKKHEFSKLHLGNSQVEILHFSKEPIQVSFSILINGFLEPTVYRIRNAFDALLSLENMIALIILLYCIYKIPMPILVKKSGIPIFSIIVILLIGYMVPNIGAILRYRSVAYLSLLMVVLSAYFETKEIETQTH